MFKYRMQVLRLMQIWLLVVLNICCVHSRRLPISENQNSMYLFSKSNSNGNIEKELSWNNPKVLRVLQSSCIIEISSRGIRSMDSSLNKKYGVCDQNSVYLNNKVKKLKMALYEELIEHCNVTFESLCWIKGQGGFFPSNKYNESQVIFSGKQHLNIESKVLKHFHSLSKKTCGSNNDGISKLGQGRVYAVDKTSDRGEEYFVTACDILQSAVLILYEPTINRIRIVPNTFGPFAYCVIIVVALIFLYGISLKYENLDMEKDKESKYKILFFGCMCVCSSIVLVIFSIYDGITFIALQDEIYFYISAILCVIIAVIGMSIQKVFYISDASLYGLCSICTAIYRTPENPYAAAISIGLAIDSWKKIYKMMSANFNDKIENERIESFCLLIDTTICAFMLCSTLELGLVPQFEEIEDWYIYSGIGCFASFASNLYLQLIQHKIIK